MVPLRIGATAEDIVRLVRGFKRTAEMTELERGHSLNQVDSVDALADRQGARGVIIRKMNTCVQDCVLLLVVATVSAARLSAETSSTRASEMPVSYAAHARLTQRSLRTNGHPQKMRAGSAAVRIESAWRVRTTRPCPGNGASDRDGRRSVPVTPTLQCRSAGQVSRTVKVPDGSARLTARDAGARDHISNGGYFSWRRMPGITSGSPSRSGCSARCL